MAAKKKSNRLAVAPPTTLVVDPLDQLIEGLESIGRAARIVDSKGYARKRVVKYRLENDLLPGFKRGRHWYSTLRLLTGMNEERHPHRGKRHDPDDQPAGEAV
jgi:hypothetical protein